MCEYAVGRHGMGCIEVAIDCCEVERRCLGTQKGQKYSALGLSLLVRKLIADSSRLATSLAYTMICNGRTCFMVG